MRGIDFGLRALTGCAVVAIAAASVPASAQEATKQFNIAAGDLGPALKAFAQQSDRELLFSTDAVAGKRTAGVRGSHSAAAALSMLLQGTGLQYRSTASGALLVEIPGGEGEAGSAAAETGDAVAADEVAPEIVVTGSRIRGTSSASPVISVSQAEAQKAGHIDLGEVVRSIPQNFNGGQNPGVSSALGLSNQNVTNASSINLRGLGPDATLTLLNGKRLSYDGFAQAVDISIIPIGALDRIEIIPDGSSAIYGSDAVGGVANIVLRRDFAGIEASATGSVLTRGGGEEHQIGIVGGHKWSEAGFIAAFQRTQSNPVMASDRSFTDYMLDPFTLYPGLTTNSAVVSAYQRLGKSVRFKLDGLFATRTSEPRKFATGTSVILSHSKSKSYFAAPTLEFDLPKTWMLTVGANYARSEATNFSEILLGDGAAQSTTPSCYCNTTFATEAYAEGPMLQLPAGNVRVVVGGGYRLNRLKSSRIGGSRSSKYAFGEVYLPVFRGVARQQYPQLDLTAALRHESYDNFGAVTTPKLGAILDANDFSLKASWGRSFKAPTLSQEFAESIVYLQLAERVGAIGFPPGSTVIVKEGAGTDLKPERARSWVITAAVHPTSMPQTRLEISAFRVSYTDRIIQPVTNTPLAFLDPIYAAFVVRNPSLDSIAQDVASADRFINFTGLTYEPGSVVGLVANNYVNVARTTVKGLDISLGQEFDLAGGIADVSSIISWLSGSQRSTPSQEPFDTVGTFFNPSHVRFRIGAGWSDGQFSTNLFLNHVGSVLDTRTDADTEAFTTFDVNLSYKTSDESFMPNLKAALSIHNIFDEEPPLFTPFHNMAPNFDSTNYSALGRRVSLSLRKGL